MYRARLNPRNASGRVRVPPEEYRSVFAMLRKKLPSYADGSWVRFKNGKFAGDFGIVEETFHDGLGIEVAAMARVDDSPDQENARRPEKRLATLSWLRQTFRTEPITHHDDGTYEFRKGLYRDGLRLLRLQVWRVEAAFPHLHEVYPFSLKHFGELQDVEGYVQVSDVVAIHSGPLRNVVGVVADRAGVDLVIRDVRRIDLLDDKGDDMDCFSRQSEDDRDERTYWENLRDMRRSDVLDDIRHTPPNDVIGERISTHVRTIRRFIDVGDEVLVMIGLNAGRRGIVVELDRDTLRLRSPGIDGFTSEELEVSASLFISITVD